MEGYIYLANIPVPLTVSAWNEVSPIRKFALSLAKQTQAKSICIDHGSLAIYQLQM